MENETKKRSPGYLQWNSECLIWTCCRRVWFLETPVAAWNLILMTSVVLVSKYKKNFAFNSFLVTVEDAGLTYNLAWLRTTDEKQFLFSWTAAVRILLPVAMLSIKCSGDCSSNTQTVCTSAQDKAIWWITGFRMNLYQVSCSTYRIKWDWRWPVAKPL